MILTTGLVTAPRPRHDRLAEAVKRTRGGRELERLLFGHAGDEFGEPPYTNFCASLRYCLKTRTVDRGALGWSLTDFGKRLLYEVKRHFSAGYYQERVHLAVGIGLALDCYHGIDGVIYWGMPYHQRFFSTRAWVTVDVCDWRKDIPRRCADLLITRADLENGDLPQIGEAIAAYLKGRLRLGPPVSLRRMRVIRRHWVSRLLRSVVVPALAPDPV